METFITLAIVLGLLVVPGLINYYVNRYFTTPGSTAAPTSELVTASLTLTFAMLVVDIAAVVLIAQGWSDLEDRIADFVQLGLLDFARDRPLALTGVLSVYSVLLMAFMGLLGVLRVPSRWIR